jgi:hypothetical protein
VTEHREELAKQMDNIGQRHEILKRDLSQQNHAMVLLVHIDRWEREAIARIQNNARIARADLKRLMEESTNRLLNLMNKLSNEFRLSQENEEYMEDDLERWTKQLEEFQKELERLSAIELSEDATSFLRLVKIKSPEERQINKSNSDSRIVHDFTEASRESLILDIDVHSTIEHSLFSSQSAVYPCVSFGFGQSVGFRIDSLFEYLKYLQPMDKHGPMSSRCRPEMDQMERFLSQTFGFKNISEKYILPDVRSFQLDRPPHSMDPETVIYFPSGYTNSFAMTVEEIIKWQRSYVVYADKNIKSMNKEFLYRALQGQIEDGEVAFRMKFVVRISTCPILMDFDTKVISRKLDEDWPNRIKLVSTTGINFAGRKHDIGDILYYISNWKNVFDIDPKTGLPLLYNGKDFYRKVNGPQAKLYEERVRGSLIRMARLRLRACDEEGVQIVVETGIGLGLAAGNNLGIDGKVRALSAEAIRTVLQQHGPSYKNIRAIVFALPMFNKTRLNQPIRNPFEDFVDEFRKSQYNGPIPVLIADQDMHRLTVAIARYGFTVSELTPADSHSVFGGYWQKDGSNVEEKVALTTLGLLVQHHLSNLEILNLNKYHFLEINGRQIVDWLTIISQDNGKMIANTCFNQ